MTEYTEHELPIGHNEETGNFEARCHYCGITIYRVSAYVADAIGSPLPQSVPHLCHA